MEYKLLKKEEGKKINEEYKSKLEAWKKKGIQLDLTRGKPGKEQLDLTEDMLTTLSKNEDCISEGGVDCRNYGLVDGLPEAKKLFSELFDIPEKSYLGLF